MRCQCNGHSMVCDSISGQCTNCMSNTAGDRCELCVSGFFGDATGGTSSDCQPCDCFVLGAVNNSCASDGRCNCKPGIDGEKCDICRSGFFNISQSGCQGYCHLHVYMQQ